ncbi:tetratricopeptide repeat protein [Bacillus sp. EB01]|uniref:tetratricopeptide repeat protein n=1 Tax=Bacillus sp. EB01 TaxID=1347086 RepID=UPI0005C658EB|nr:tetratricopeptide repeat protein [Bacillus sp. EB01]
MDRYEESYHFHGEGMVRFENGDYQTSLNCFLKSCELNEHFKTYARIGECLAKLGKQNEAVTYMKKAYELNPNSDKASLQYSEALIMSGNEGQRNTNKTIRP